MVESPPALRPDDVGVFGMAEFAGRFSQLLHQAGVTVTAERAVRFLEVMRLLPPADRPSLYWAARLAFVAGRDQIAPFDRVFDAVFGGMLDPAESRGDPNAPSLDGIEPDPRGTSPPPTERFSQASGSALPGGATRSAGGEAAEREVEALPMIASYQEVLASKDLGTFDDAELAALRQLMAALVVATPVRRTRRRRPDPGGRHIDLRRSLRQSQRTGGDPVRLAYSRNHVRRRRLVMICDVSGSMETYTRAYLHFFQRAAAGVSAEAFVFATRLTRLTLVLRNATPEVALQRAGLTAPDWSGGTRIGEALAEFNNGFGRRGMARGAVVVIFSDGWERDDPGAVGREMARLARLAYRIVWVNPRKAAEGYAPLAGGMAAALPYCDAFVCGHSVNALAEAIQAIADPTAPRSRRHQSDPKPSPVRDETGAPEPSAGTAWDGPALGFSIGGDRPSGNPVGLP